jgi:hypothetical protein
MDSGLRQNDESSIYGFRQMVTITINGERREFAEPGPFALQSVGGRRHPGAGQDPS